MIKEKLKLAKQILTEHPQTRGDKGTGEFLNIVAKTIYNNNIDFRYFNVESWSRARRKALELYPYLDERSFGTFEAQRVVESEVA